MTRLTRHQKLFFASVNEILAKAEEFKSLKHFFNIDESTSYSSLSNHVAWLVKHGYLEVEVIDKIKHYRRIKPRLTEAEYEAHLEKISVSRFKGGNIKKPKPEYEEEKILALCQVYGMYPRCTASGVRGGMDKNPEAYLLQAQESTKELKAKKVKNYVSGQSLGSF